MQCCKKWNKILLLETRNFGDAIIKNKYIRTIGKQYPNIQIDLLTKEQLVPIFRANSFIAHIYYAKFPIAGFKSLNVLDLGKRILQLKKEGYDLCIETTGDFREALICKMIDASECVSLQRGQGHPYNHLIRRPWIKNANRRILIPDQIINIYDQYRYALELFGIKEEKIQPERRRYNAISIHPFASQECKMWGWKKWETMVKKLIQKRYKIKIFCTPNESKIVKARLETVVQNKNVELYAGPLARFLDELKKSDLLIGLDSFSIHASYACNVPNIMICGANQYEMWKTPLTEVVSNSGQCDKWPCYNVPKCRGEQKFICIKQISEEEVYTKACELLELES